MVEGFRIVDIQNACFQLEARFNAYTDDHDLAHLIDAMRIVKMLRRNWSRDEEIFESHIDQVKELAFRLYEYALDSRDALLDRFKQVSLARKEAYREYKDTRSVVLNLCWQVEEDRFVLESTNSNVAVRRYSRLRIPAPNSAAERSLINILIDAGILDDVVRISPTLLNRALAKSDLAQATVDQIKSICDVRQSYNLRVLPRGTDEYSAQPFRYKAPDTRISSSCVSDGNDAEARDDVRKQEDGYVDRTEHIEAHRESLLYEAEIREELDEWAEDWARASTDGWFYDDEDADLWYT